MLHGYEEVGSSESNELNCAKFEQVSSYTSSFLNVMLDYLGEMLYESESRVVGERNNYLQQMIDWSICLNAVHFTFFLEFFICAVCHCIRVAN
jgi:hypothetical protein